MVLSNESMWINKMYQIILSQSHQEITYFYCYKIILKYASELHFKLCWLSSIVRTIIKILLAFIKGTMNEKNQIMFHISSISCRAPKTLSSISLSGVLEKAYLRVFYKDLFKIVLLGRRGKILWLWKLWLMWSLIVQVTQ